MGISNDPSKGELSKYLTKHTIREQFTKSEAFMVGQKNANTTHLGGDPRSHPKLSVSSKNPSADSSASND
jgi:hypothetical protein